MTSSASPAAAGGGSRRTVRSIQFLRAFAALAVVYYHAVDAGGNFALPSTGAWGVDVFFVISGFIIGTVTVGRRAQFFRRRVFRVVPLYWIATFAWIAAMLVVPSRVNSTEVTGAGIVKSLLFVPYQMTLRDGPILQLGWTLEYEMFFYVVVGVLLVMLRGARRALVGTAVLLGALVASGIAAPSADFVLRFYQSPLLLEFLAGVVVAMIARRLSSGEGVLGGIGARWSATTALRRTGYAAAVLLVIAAFGALLWQDLALGLRYGEQRALAYGAPALALVVSALFLEPLIRDGRVTRLLLELGDGSYAMYLFHQFVLALVAHLLLADVIEDAGTAVRTLLLVVVIVAVCLVGVLVNRLIDAPIQRALRKLLPPPSSRIPAS